LPHIYYSYLPSFYHCYIITSGVFFSGWTDPTNALRESNLIFGKVPNPSWISLGGGNANGAFTASSLNIINTAIQNGQFNNYRGIVFDIEEGDSGLYSSFAQCFRTAVAKGLGVMVTVSHSAPYGISDAASLMKSLLADPNVKYISPQLYTSGTENVNDFAISQGFPWSAYKNTKAIVIPSIVKSSYYPAAQAYFASQGVTTQGYIQWSQTV